MNGKKCKLYRKLTGVDKSSLIPTKLGKNRLEHFNPWYIEYNQYKKTGKGVKFTRESINNIRGFNEQS